MTKIKQERNKEVEGIIERILILLDFYFSFGDNCIPQCFIILQTTFNAAECCPMRKPVTVDFFSVYLKDIIGI